MKITLYFFLVFTLLLGTLNAEVADSDTTEIKMQKLNMNLVGVEGVEMEILLPDEIAETEVQHVAIAGLYSHTEKFFKDYDNILIFFKGKGTLSAGKDKYKIEPESIAFANMHDSISIQASDGSTLHYLNIKKRLSAKDLEDIKSFPVSNRHKIYFTKFDDCEAYTEKIKSPNTISRTVLPKDIIPRVAMGTVETKGPDAVGAHEHPMLDQLFFGLAGNEVTVYADDAQVHFTEYTLLHIPIGSSHSVSVEEDKYMYYQWMDFFITADGQEWLKTHKPIKDYENDSSKNN